MSSFSDCGLSIVIDYNDLISKLMEVQRQPINILENKKSLYNQKISQYIRLSSKLSNLKNAADKLKTLTNFYFKPASVDDSMVMEVAVTNSAVIGYYSIIVRKRTSEETEVHIGVDASTTVVSGSGNEKMFQYTYGGIQRTPSAESGSTIEGLRNHINDDIDSPEIPATLANEGVEATLYQWIIKGDGTGAINKITVDAGPTIDGYDSTADFSADASTGDKTAKDSDFKADGLKIIGSSNNIKDVILGMTINPPKEIASSTITVIPGMDAIKEQINSFISAYNDVIDLISKNMAYDSVSGKGGILSGEDTVKNIQNCVRNIISSTVSGQPDDLNVLAQLGITTDSKTGKLIVNTTTLNTKLASDLTDVSTLFTNSTDGIANQFYNYISTADGSITIRETGLKNVILRIDKTIKNMEYRLDKTEESLINKYMSLEALAQSKNRSITSISKKA